MAGSLLHYVRALDGTMLPLLSTIGAEQAIPTRKIEEKYKRLLDYVATYPNVFIRYHASEMVFHIDSDAA